jgi:hypothetical protein
MLLITHSLKLLFSFCFCMTVSAQSKTINLHFVSFPKTANPEPVELLIGENETMEIELPTNNISQAYTVPALSTWALGKSSAPDAEEPIFEKYGTTPSIKSKSQLVLALRSDKDESNNLELMTLDYSQDGFGGGEYLFVNATKVDIGGVIGERKFAIKPGKSTLIAPKPTKKQGDRNYSYARFFFRNNDKSKGFFSATWRLNERARSMVFFYHDPGTRQIRLHIIRGFLP